MKMSVQYQTMRDLLSTRPMIYAGEGYWETSFSALGSQCELFFAADDVDHAGSFRDAAFDWLAAFGAKWSRFIGDSHLSLINANAGKSWTETDAQLEMLLDLCDHMHFVTRGAFDATSLPLSELWDWKQKHRSLPTEEEIAKAKKFIGWKRVQREPGRVLLPDQGMKLDFGGVGKEFAVDCLLQTGLGLGLKHLMVDLGGDIAVHGEPPEGGGWYVGLEDPSDTSRCYCGIRLRSGFSVATSGDYRRCFEFDGVRYGHIMDCRTGYPVAHGTQAVTVLAPRCTIAGLLSTSAMILGGQEAITMLDSTPGAEGCLWDKGRLRETRGFRRNILPRDWDEDDDTATLTPPMTTAR